MIYAFLIVCAIAGPQTGLCDTVEDTRGPYETLVECRNRTEEMRAFIIISGSTNRIRPGTTVLMNKECLPEEERDTFIELFLEDIEPDEPQRPDFRT